MRAIICGVLMALTTMMTSAAEDTNSAGYILPYCKLSSEQAAADPFKAFIHGRCHGVVEAIGKIHQAHMVGDRALCTDMPGSVTHAQALQAVVTFVEAHPDQTHMPFWRVTMSALHDAWPCKQER